MPKFGIKVQQEPGAPFMTNVSSTGVCVFLFNASETDTRIFVVHNVSKDDLHNLLEHDKVYVLQSAQAISKNYKAKEKDLLFRFTNTHFFQFYYFLETENNLLKKKS